MDLVLLADMVPYVLIAGGVSAASWLLEKLAKPVPIVGKPVSSLAKVLSVLGFLVGILMLATAAGVWMANAYAQDTGTRYLLLLAGLALFLRPLKDVPWAALVGLIVGGACLSLVYFLFPLPEIVFGISSTWLYLAVFLIPALLAYVVAKFLEDLFKLVGTILSSRPVIIPLGLVCILQGCLLLLGSSLFQILPS
jgi:peptidoglycan/LPS O-acetylase OafA/YrhL